MSKKLGKKLKDYRLGRGMTVQKMAERLGVPKRTYEEWESGRRHPWQPGLMLIKRILRIENGRRENV